MAKFSSNGEADFLVGSFAQKMSEFSSRNTAEIDYGDSLVARKISKLHDSKIPHAYCGIFGIVRTMKRLFFSVLLFSFFLPIFVSGAGRAIIEIQPKTIMQGETLVIKVTPTVFSGTSTISAWVGSRRLWLFPYNDSFLGFYSAPAKATPMRYRATIAVNREPAVKIPVTIKNAKFPVTKLVVTDQLKNSGFTSNTIGSNLATNDTPALIGALAHPSNKPYFTKSFGYPLEKIVNVGAFGNYRKSGKTVLQHLGTDLEATPGTPVYAINDGVVTMATRLINYGNTIVIDHGAHIFSMSLHLDRFSVSPGDRITKGQIIGYSGNTGYSIAPHFHLSVNVNGTSIDPLKFIETTQTAMK